MKSKTVALTNVTVIAGSGAAAMPDQTIAIDNGRIVSAGDSATAEVMQRCLPCTGRP